jgi:hypothetical protein
MYEVLQSGGEASQAGLGHAKIPSDPAGQNGGG